MTALVREMVEQWWHWMAPMFWQAALLIVIVGFVDAVLRRWAWPQVRHALWLLVVVKLVLPPSLASPVSLTAGVFAAGTFPASERTRSGAAILRSGKAFDSPATVPEASGEGFFGPSAAARGTDANGRSTLVWHAILMGLWFSGVILLGSWAAVRFGRLRREFRAAAPPPEAYVEMFRSVAARLGLRRPPGLAFSPRVTSPAVFGIFRRVVVLPQEFRDRRPDEAVRYALLHELAHIRRGDLYLHALFLMLQILYWFHPLLWWVRRRLQPVRELCCDATVARVLKEETPGYRDTLLAAAERLLNRSPLPAHEGLGFLGLIERSGELLSRLHWLERGSGRPSRLRTAAVVATVVAMLAAVLPMAKSGAASTPRTASEEAPTAATNVPSTPVAAASAPAIPAPERQIRVRLCIATGPEEAVRDLALRLVRTYSGKVGLTPDGEPDLPEAAVLSDAANRLSWEKLQEMILEKGDRAKSDLAVLCCPILVTGDGQQAKIFVGQTIPVFPLPENPKTEKPASPNYQEIGTTCLLTPRVVNGGSIQIALNYENKAIVEWRKTGPFWRRSSIPIIRARQLEAKVALGEGQIAILRVAGVSGEKPRSAAPTKEQEPQLVFVMANRLEGTAFDQPSGTLTFDPGKATAVLDAARELVTEMNWQLKRESGKTLGTSGETVTIEAVDENGKTVTFTAAWQKGSTATLTVEAGQGSQLPASEIAAEVAKRLGLAPGPRRMFTGKR